MTTRPPHVSRTEWEGHCRASFWLAVRAHVEDLPAPVRAALDRLDEASAARPLSPNGAA